MGALCLFKTHDPFSYLPLLSIIINYYTFIIPVLSYTYWRYLRKVSGTYQTRYYMATLGYNMKPSVQGSSGDDACDYYHRYEEDLARISEYGFNTYRFPVASAGMIWFWINRKGDLKGTWPEYIYLQQTMVFFLLKEVSCSFWSQWFNDNKTNYGDTMG